MSIVTEPIDIVDAPPVAEVDASTIDRMHQRGAAIVAAVAGGLAVVTAIVGLLVLGH